MLFVGPEAAKISYKGRVTVVGDGSEVRKKRLVEVDGHRVN